MDDSGPAPRRLLRRGRRFGRRVLARAVARGRDAGLLPYRPEHWSIEQWTTAYAGGQLDYYGSLPELGRYSALVGYASWYAAATGRRPSVLDVGCGSGLLRERLEGSPLSSYVGVDLSEASIAMARAAGHARSEFLVGDISAMALGRRFDLVVLNEVLYYAEDAEGFLVGLRARLESGGLVLVSMWRHPGDQALWRSVAAAFPIIDRVEVRNSGNRVNPRGWHVAMCGVLGEEPLGERDEAEPPVPSQ